MALYIGVVKSRENIGKLVSILIEEGTTIGVLPHEFM
jgi:hypothetical protein